MHHQAPAMSPQVQSVRVISTISQRSNPHPTFSSSYQTCGGRASIHNITLLKLKHSETSADLPFNEVVGLNKTKTRNSLALDGTLSSIMTIKMADLEPCFKWEPPSDVLKASKKATGQYNRAHRS
ncbi:unnamed protein product [Boreogadus saida]